MRPKRIPNCVPIRRPRAPSMSGTGPGRACALLTLWMGLGAGFGQVPPSVRCDLVLRATPGTAKPPDCLDLSALDGGAALKTGGNVTRIAQQGLKFCKDPFQVTTGGSADIVFIVDNSGSMWSTRAFVKGGDTVFINDGSCGVGTTGATLAYPVWDDKSAPNPPKGARSVGLLQSDPGTNCEFAGDPYTIRAYVVRKAIDFLAANSPLSTAGVVGFAAATMHEQAPLQLDQAASVAKVKASMVPDSAFGTNYGIALDTASKWLADTARVRNAKQAIVLISDGRPGWGFDLAKDSTRFPVFGIYLGKTSTPDTATLKGLSVKTGGLFFRVDPSKGGSLLAVMDSILKKITATAVPKSLTLSNGSLSIPQASMAAHMSLDARENLSVDLDSILALNPGPNAISIKTTLADGTRKEFVLNIQADGAPSAQSGGDLQCYPQASLAILNSQGQPAGPYPPGPATDYTFRLARSPAGAGAVIIQATTRDSARMRAPIDAESLPLAAAGNAEAMSVFAGTYSLDGSAPRPIVGNGALEAMPGGWLDLSWRHPRDAREAAAFSLQGSNIPVTLPPSADPPSGTFTTLDPELTVALLPGEPGAIIRYTLDGSEPGPDSPLYAAPIRIAATTLLKAFDVKPGRAASPIVAFRYVRTPAPKVATPVADPPGAGVGAFAFARVPKSIVFSDATPGAGIWYSFNGSVPVSAAGVSLEGSGILKLYATRAGMYPSDTAVIRFEYDAPSRVYVRFPDGGLEPPHGDASAADPRQPYAFIPIDKAGNPLPGDRDGKCGPKCAARNGSEGLMAGPILYLEIPGPCRYTLSVFTNQGGFVARSAGVFTAEDLERFDPSADGSRRVARVVWTGHAQDGSFAASGAYVLRTDLIHLGGPLHATPLSSRTTLTLFGLVRNPR